MPVKPCSLRIDGRQHEMERRGTPMFPCGGYTMSVGGHTTACIPWHWHDEVELISVAGGTLALETPDHQLVLQEGEAAFLNAGVLHSAVNANDRICEIRSLVFDPQLVFGALESAMEQKYVRPLLNCPQLCVLPFQRALEWHREALGCIEEALLHYRQEAYGHELLVRDCLSRLWFLIVSHERGKLEQHQYAQNTEVTRVKEMLGYIHAHYTEPIKLADIARSAAISDRECLRCFNRVVGTTPIQYLLNHRISVAAGLLINTDRSITEIGRLSGFASPSYFSLKFQSLTDCTPRQYRLRGKGDQ